MLQYHRYVIGFDAERVTLLVRTYWLCASELEEDDI